MHFPTTTAAISSLLMVIASTSTDISFSIPSTVSATAAVPGAPEGVLTTTVYETSTFYVTTAIMVPVPVASVSEVISAPANSSVTAPSSGSAIATTPAFQLTPTQSLFVSGTQTFVPVTLWEGSTTRVIYPQNSTAVDIPTGYPNGTTVVVTTSVASSAVSTSKGLTSSKHSSVSEAPSATVSEVPTNGGGKVAGEVVLGLGVVAGLMALL